jgi:hypothetical protein
VRRRFVQRALAGGRHARRGVAAAACRRRVSGMGEKWAVGVATGFGCAGERRLTATGLLMSGETRMGRSRERGLYEEVRESEEGWRGEDVAGVRYKVETREM